MRRDKRLQNWNEDDEDTTESLPASDECPCLGICGNWDGKDTIEIRPASEGGRDRDDDDKYTTENSSGERRVSVMMWRA